MKYKLNGKRKRLGALVDLLEVEILATEKSHAGTQEAGT